MATAFFRTVFLYLLLIFGLRITGKRQIGELEPNELVLTMLLSDLAAVPMQNFGIPLVCGVVPIATILALSMLLSLFSLHSVRFRRVLCGESAMIIRDGKLQQSAMRRNRLTVDELLEELRCQGVTDIKTVKYAILETSGQLTILPYTPEEPYLPTVLISDGRLLEENLRRVGREEKWLDKELHRHKAKNAAAVFLLTVDERGETTCILKEGTG